MPDRPQKITFAELREQGVRGVLVYCSDYKCSHSINDALTLHTAKTHPALGRDPKRRSTTTEPLPLEPHSVLPELRVGRTDRPGRLQGDNDIVERYNNPKELALPRAPSR
jgi:hypothetical protein